MGKSKILPVMVGGALAMAPQLNTAKAQTTTNTDPVTEKIEQVANADLLTPITKHIAGDVLNTLQSNPEGVAPDTIDFFTAQEQFGGKQGEGEDGGPGIETDPGEGGGNGEGDTGDSQSEESKESQGNKPGVRIGYNAGMQNYTFMPGSGGILGYRPSFSTGVNASLKDFSVGFSRMTDFDPNNPKTSSTQMSASYNKKIGLSNDWNIYVGATGAYIHFDHSFNIADYGNVKLNEMMGIAQFSLKGKPFSVGLGFIYNMYLNGITPNNLITKLEASINFGETALTGESRLKFGMDGQKSLSAAIGVKQQFPEGFSAYLRVLANDINKLNKSDNGLKPQIVLTVGKNGVFPKGLSTKKKK